jgi:CYTH domain-containing protein
MGREIERKFLVTGDGWRHGSRPTRMRQGYLFRDDAGRRHARVRIAGERAILAIKALVDDITRREYEYEIPMADAAEMLETMCDAVIDKTRHVLEFGGRTWEVDEFHGANTGLAVAEVELDDPRQTVELPPWVGDEVSADPRYLNVNLARNPWRDWRDR